MAKDDKADETYEFSLPDFDEQAFIHREMVSFRTTSILFVWGIVAALVSWGIYVALDGSYGWPLGLLVCAAFGFALKPLFPMLGADIRHFKRRDWVGTGFLFFFTWLSIFMLVLNPPLTDVAPPTIEAAASPPVVLAGSTLSFTALAVDNLGVSEASYTLARLGDPAPLPAVVGPSDQGRTNITLANAAPGTYQLTATARDAKGHVATRTVNATVGTAAVQVLAPATMDATSRVVVRMDKSVAELDPCTHALAASGASCVREVVLTVEGAGTVTLTAANGDWSATSDYAGWRQGTNTFQAHVRFLDRFLGARHVPGGELVLPSQTLNMTVAPGTTVQAPLVPQPSAPSVPIPASSLVAVLVVLVGAAMVRRRPPT